jgi:hypothetical protein
LSSSRMRIPCRCPGLAASAASAATDR